MPSVNGADVLALGPVGVLPDRQSGGIGEALIAHGLITAAALGHTAVVVLGDPRSYERFGIEPCALAGILPPVDDWPSAAFRARSLSGGPLPAGTMRYPTPFGV